MAVLSQGQGSCKETVIFWSSPEGSVEIEFCKFSALRFLSGLMVSGNYCGIGMAVVWNVECAFAGVGEELGEV